MATAFTEEMLRLVLKADESASRFERFCSDLFSEVDGVDYAVTSSNYDQGRDARVTGKGAPNAPAAVSARLRSRSASPP